MPRIGEHIRALTRAWIAEIASTNATHLKPSERITRTKAVPVTTPTPGGDGWLPRLAQSLSGVRNGILFFLAFCAGTTIVSVGITALLATTLGSDLQLKMGPIGQIFESVNAAFSGLGFVALVLTFRLQYDELRLQRRELENQRNALENLHTELHRSVKCEARARHVDLIRIGLRDDELADVWPDVQPGLTRTAKRQRLYADLIIQHYRMLHQIEQHTNSEVRSIFHSLFTSKHMRNAWAAQMDFREARSATALHLEFDRLVDEVYREACSCAPPTHVD